MIKGAIPVCVDKTTGKLVIDKKLVDELREKGEEVNDVLHGKQLTEDDNIFDLVEQHAKEMIVKLETMKLCWLSEIWSWDKIYPFVKQRMILHYYNEIRDYKFTTKDINSSNEYDSPFSRFLNEIKNKFAHVNNINKSITDLYKEAKGSDISDYAKYLRALIPFDSSEIEHFDIAKMWMFDEIYKRNFTKDYKLRSMSECPFNHSHTIHKKRMENDQCAKLDNANEEE